MGRLVKGEVPSGGSVDQSSLQARCLFPSRTQPRLQTAAPSLPNHTNPAKVLFSFCCALEDSYWTSSAGRMVLLLICTQAALGQAGLGFRSHVAGSAVRGVASVAPLRWGVAMLGPLPPLTAPPPCYPLPPPSQISYRLSRHPVPENLVLLALYAALAAALLRRQIRAIQGVWAEALSVKPGGAAKLGWVGGAVIACE